MEQMMSDEIVVPKVERVTTEEIVAESRHAAFRELLTKGFLSPQQARDMENSNPVTLAESGFRVHPSEITHLDNSHSAMLTEQIEEQTPQEQERTAQVRVRPARAQCPRIVEALLGTPWAIESDKLAAIAEFISIRAVAGQPIPAAAVEMYAASARPLSSVRDSVAVLPIHGVISHRMNLMSAMSGGTSSEQIGRDLDQLAADPNISAIVLDIDSPGGAVNGTPELGAKVASAKALKPVIAVANARAASAAYWLAAQASEIVVTPSGEVGSIGVVGMHRDMSKAYEAEGVLTTLISAGKYKTEGHPFGPLGEEARAAFQAQVDDAYGQFVSAVASGRKVEEQTVRDGFGQGRMVSAKQAVRMGMADKIATLDETVNRMLSARSRANALRRAAAAFEIQKRA